MNLPRQYFLRERARCTFPQKYNHTKKGKTIVPAERLSPEIICVIQDLCSHHQWHLFFTNANWEYCKATLKLYLPRLLTFQGSLCGPKCTWLSWALEITSKLWDLKLASKANKTTVVRTGLRRFPEKQERLGHAIDGYMFLWQWRFP